MLPEWTGNLGVVIDGVLTLSLAFTRPEEAWMRTSGKLAIGFDLIPYANTLSDFLLYVITIYAPNH